MNVEQDKVLTKAAELTAQGHVWGEDGVKDMELLLSSSGNINDTNPVPSQTQTAGRASNVTSAGVQIGAGRGGRHRAFFKYKNKRTGEAGGFSSESNDPRAVCEDATVRQQWIEQVRQQHARDEGWRLEDTEITLTSGPPTDDSVGKLPRVYPIPEMAKRQITENTGLWAVLVPAIILGESWGQTQRVGEVLEQLESSGWHVSQAFLAMRDAKSRDLGLLVSMCTPAMADGGNEQAFVEHLLCCVREAERDGRAFVHSPDGPTGQIWKKQEQYGRLAKAIVSGGDEEWVGSFLQEQESHGWELTGPVHRMRAGTRDLLAVLGADCDANSCSIANHILETVCQLEGTSPQPTNPGAAATIETDGENDDWLYE